MWLKPARIDNAPKAPQHWQQIPHGGWWRDALAVALEPHWETLFGHYLLSLGPLSHGLPNRCRIREQYCVGPGSKAHVHAEYNALPFSENTVDAVLLTHVLEYASDPHSILREVDRVLRADGHLLLALTNPWSPTTVARMWPAWRKSPLLNTRMFSQARVSDWLNLMHYEVIHQGYFAAGVPTSTVKDPEKGWRWLMRQWPSLQAGYYMIARKREWPITPVRMGANNRQKQRIALGASGVSTRSSD
ncbi:class I SAM-dependent methyltransferase [Aliidiomarina indica]|uniref:class I SAM-dependent methyltransferase n=1 Tax=Aliidiomarina indica TaxID=2749147 RepID=UPI00188F5463|nr:class I SAM-dependent methyltransferase [Aliidiomarina indica]